MDNEKIGKIIKSARINKGYTQKDVANILGVTDKAVSKWECGRSFPDITLIKSISTVLDIDVYKLVGIACDSKEELMMIKKINKKILISSIIFFTILILFLFRIITKIFLGYVIYWKIEDFANMLINIILFIIGGASLISSIILIIKRRMYENNNKNE